MWLPYSVQSVGSVVSDNTNNVGKLILGNAIDQHE